MPDPLLVLAAVVAVSGTVVLVVAVLRRPQRGVLLLAALVPFDGLLLLVNPPAWLDAWKQALVGLIVVGAVVAPGARRPGDRRLPGWLLPLAGLVVVAVLSAVVVGGTQGLNGLRIDFFYVVLVPALLRCPMTARDRDRLVSVLMATGVTTALYGLVQQVVGHAALHAWGYEYDSAIRFAGGILRSFSTFNQPFPFGLFLMLVLLVGLPVALAQPRRPRNAAFLIAVPLLAAALVSTTVRGAMLGLVTGLVVLTVLRHRGLLHWLAPVAMAATAIPSRFAATLLSGDSLGDRASSWDEMTQVVLRSPLGIGIGATGAAAQKTAESGADASGTLFTATFSTGYQPDNFYVKTLLELGPAGLWLLVLGLVTTFLAARAAGRDTTGSDAALARGIAASMAAAGAASLVATYFEIFPLDVYFWLLVGVLAGSYPRVCTGSSVGPEDAVRASSRPAGRGAPLG